MIDDKEPLPDIESSINKGLNTAFNAGIDAAVKVVMDYYGYTPDVMSTIVEKLKSLKKINQ